jgi:hypothetical protein
MGVVSGTVLADGGVVTGVVPYAMQKGGGETDKLVVSAIVELPQRVEKACHSSFSPSSMCNNDLVIVDGNCTL